MSGLVVVLVTIVTVLLRRRVQSRLGLSPYDAMLYVDGARSLGRHDWLGGYDNLTLAKVPGYPLFIAMCDRLGLQVKDAEQLVACLAALAVAVCALLATRRLAVAAAVFLVCAFEPVYFSSWSADYMRDALFASVSTLAVVALFLTGWSLVRGRAFGWSLVAAAVAGISLAAYLLLREEGVTVVPTAVVALGAMPLVHLVRYRARRDRSVLRTRRPRWVLRAALRSSPAVLVLVVTLAAPIGAVLVKNERVYGVATTSEMADGAFVDAYAQWQRVDAGPVAYRVPISQAQRVAVYRVSPAARSLAPALEDPDNPWRFSGCSTVPDCDYAGGWMTWAMRDAAAEAGAFSSARMAEAFWQRLAGEIATACEDGRLSCRVKLPSALQPVQRISAGAFLESFEKLSGSPLSSKDAYLTLDGEVLLTQEQRDAFHSVAQEVPPTRAAAARQRADYADHRWQYEVLEIAYSALFPVLVGLGLLLLVVLLATRRGRRAAGPLTVLAVVLLAGALARLALIAIVDAADYDADQPRYLYPARELLLAFGVVAVVEGLSQLRLRRLGKLVRSSDVPETPDASAPGGHLVPSGRGASELALAQLADRPPRHVGRPAVPPSRGRRGNLGVRAPEDESLGAPARPAFDPVA